MKKDKVYISGPITSIGVDAARERFNNTEEYLKALGYRTCNPMKMRLPVWMAIHLKKSGYKLCLLMELVWLAMTCDIIYLQRGWHESRGAKAEKSLAKAIGLPILFEQSKADT